MLKNLLRVALRNFQRDKWYSLLNILGLTIGISFSVFLILYVRDELSFDRFHERTDRIFRVEGAVQESDKAPMKIAFSQTPLAGTLQKEYPDVEEAARFLPAGRRNMYKRGDLHLYEDKVYYADSNLFRIFTFPFIQGDPHTALLAPNSIVLTESAAKKFFGTTTGVIGQTLQKERDNFKVTGIIKDIPSNSHIRFNMLLSASTLPSGDNNWGNFNVYTYVLLRPNADPAAFEKKLETLYDKYMVEIFKPVNVKVHYMVHPISWIHLHSDLQFEPEDLGSISYVYIFMAVAFFMLIIACINYMNLTTARSARRAKEIGIRKVTGSTRPQLIAQFLLESMLTAVFALLLSIGLVALLLPVFNTLAGKSIPFSTVWQPGMIGLLLAMILFVGFLGGSYPAFYLAKFDPIHILKGNLSKSSSNTILRQILVVTQFSIAMIMLICTLVVYNQLNYIRSKDLGFDKSQVLTIVARAGDITSQLKAFKNEMRKDPHVLSVAISETEPGGNPVSFSLFHVPTKDGAWADQALDNYGVDEDYFKTLGMQITRGRDFTGLADTLRSIIVNENFVKNFGWDNPIGKHVKFPGDTSAFYLEVVGVVKDFNQKSLYNPIGPELLFYKPYSGNHIQLKLDAGDVTGTLAGIQQTWRTIFPELPFEYNFLDQGFESQYAADQRRGKLFTAFSVLTVMITCLGLLGLIAFITQQRQKEISMRKIMGARVGQIVTLITRNFVILVGISCLIAFPVAFFFMDKWLKIFPYNTGLSLTPFVLAALTVLLITLLTVIYHTMRAALANPSKSLRSE